MRIVERVAVCPLAVERLLWQLWLLVRQACSGRGRQIEQVWAGFHVYMCMLFMEILVLVEPFAAIVQHFGAA